MPKDPADISVTISLYNKEKTIERAVLSVVNQTRPPKNIIIVDDGSTDRSSEIASQLARSYSFVRYIKKKNQGVSVARNRGVEEADTDYVCFLDADDIWEPVYMEHLLQLMEIADDADVYCLAYQINSEYGMLKPHVALPDDFEGIVKDPLNAYTKGYGLIHTSAICFNQSFFWEIGGFPEGVNFGEDLYLWIKACLNGKVAFSNKISTTLFKEQINSVNRRKLHPYHISYFTDHLGEFKPEDQKSIKDFLIKNINIQWAAAKIENNKNQQDILRKYSYRLSYLNGLLLQLSDWLPVQLFQFLKARRAQKRKL